MDDAAFSARHAGSDRLRLAVLAALTGGPVALGALVSRLEALILEDGNASLRGVSRCLHDMQRRGQIVLATDGKRWRVSLGPKGRWALQRLEGAETDTPQDRVPLAARLRGLVPRLVSGLGARGEREVHV